MRTTRFVVAITLSCVSCFGADWLTDGGSPVTDLKASEVVIKVAGRV